MRLTGATPATLSQWVYQIWQFLQDNPIATETEIREFIQSELSQSSVVGEAVDAYLTENPPESPVQSVQGKTGAVTLAYNDIVASSNAVPVYKAASTPSTSTLTGQYNLGYRLFVNTTTQEIYTISPAGALSLVGRGNFDGTTIDVNTSEGDTTIAEKFAEMETINTQGFTGSGISFSARKGGLYCMLNGHAGTTSVELKRGDIITNIPTGYRPLAIAYVRDMANNTYELNTNGDVKLYSSASVPTGTYVRLSCVYIVE